MRNMVYYNREEQALMYIIEDIAAQVEQEKNTPGVKTKKYN